MRFRQGGFLSLVDDYYDEDDEGVLLRKGLVLMAEEQSVNIGVVNPEAMIIQYDDGSVVIDFQPGGDEPQTVPLALTSPSSWMHQPLTH